MNIDVSSRCCICLEEYNDASNHDPVLMSCGHVFGRSCIAGWGERVLSCPVCRHEYSSLELHRLSGRDTMGRVEPEQNYVVIPIETMDRLQPEQNAVEAMDRVEARRNAIRRSIDRFTTTIILALVISQFLAYLTRMII
ncbi:RING finger domain-containing protein [Endozoicomonas sp. ONNA2]|uniref:RING finger domain-containing protein n=1 Tax=Endozoicomonas sp. ONNA2 TaxID=2828741 RepID=UPI0035A1D0D1